jgi:hypothetical protein
MGIDRTFDGNRGKSTKELPTAAPLYPVKDTPGKKFLFLKFCRPWNVQKFSRI